MTTDKRLAQTQNLNKEYGASLTIQFPTTSAYHSNRNHHISNSYSSNISDNISSKTHTSNANSFKDCHQPAATRNLSQASVTATSTIDSDDLTAPQPPNYYEIPGIVPAYQGRTSGPPPSYDDVVNPNAQPPSYQSLFGQVREASKTSNGLVDLFRQLFLILIGTLGCTMIIGVLLLIPITMILVGIVYVNDCKAESIPSFLVVGGLVWIIKNILNCYNQFKKDSSTANRPPPRRTPISTTRSSTATATPSSSASTSRSNSSAASVITVSEPPNTIANSTDRSTDSTSSHISSIVRSSSIASTSTSSSSTTTSSSTSQVTQNSVARQTDESNSASRHRNYGSSRDLQTVPRVRNPSLIGITSFKCESMLNYFLIVWFIAGCIVVYRIYEPDYDNPLSSSYCNRTVYLYAFWLMTSTFILIAIVLSCLCCLMASSLMSCNHGR